MELACVKGKAIEPSCQETTLNLSNFFSVLITGREESGTSNSLYYLLLEQQLLLLLLRSRISSVRLCATPQTAAQQAPLSLGFSRQEHWSGLPFPSPKHGSEK